MSSAAGPRRMSRARLYLLFGACLVCISLAGCGGGNSRPEAAKTVTKAEAKADGEPLGSDWGGGDAQTATPAFKDKADVKDKTTVKDIAADKDKAASIGAYSNGLMVNGGFGGRSDAARQPTNSRDQPIPGAEVGVGAIFKPSFSPADALPLAEPPPDKAPQVWHRDAARPPLARVYVGDGNSLDLVSLHVTVTVEGPRARTVVDHVFRNPHDRRLEGTFEYPLPAGASPSYFAMFLGNTRDAVPPRFARRGDAPALTPDALARMQPEDMVKYVNDADWGPLQQGRIVGNDKATETYEEIVRGRIDPALLEYAGGNTFRGRVFPIAPRGYNRVLLAYEELLPVVGDRMVYRFPLPGKVQEMTFSLQAAAGECTHPEFSPADSVKQEGGGRLLFTRAWEGGTADGEVTFACTPADPRIQAVSGRQDDNGPHYVYARLRPDLPQVDKAQPFADHAVFLLDTSLSEHPDRFAVSMKLLRKILETDPDIRQFNVLTFNVGAAWVEPKGWLPNTAEGRETALARLDGLVLEGATDLSCALDKLLAADSPAASGAPLNCFLLSDGAITWGDAGAAGLAARFARRCPFPTRFHCYRTGLGAENAELFDALTRAGGGVYDCYGEAGVAAAARAHRNQCLEVEKVRFVGGAVSDVLTAGRRAAVYPGGELVVAGKAAGAGRLQIVVEGRFMGRPFAEEFPVVVGDGGELAPRAWGELAVAGLLALNDARLEPLATAYCQQFGVVSRVASFLVLENDNDYKRLNLEAERGRTLPGDLGPFLDAQWRALGQPGSPRQAFQRFLKQMDARARLEGGPVWKLLAMLDDADFDLPENNLAGALLHAADVPPDYLQAREKDWEAVAPYLTEMKRRAAAGDSDGAVRVLSSVVEEHPARGDALRLVGYRLLDLNQPAQAARLFGQVQKQRPFEPHSYRDLARSLEDCGKYGLAAAQYEVVLAGTWHNRFGPALKQVAQEEYVRMMREAVRRKAVGKDLSDYFEERLSRLAGPQSRADLRVTISWNTDGTDVDLWVIEPDGTKVFYGNRQGRFGSELSPDETQGYGPERYQIARAQPGTYTIIVHYFRPNPNLLGGETHVNVTVARKDGDADASVERHTIVLKKQDQQVEVSKVRF